MDNNQLAKDPLLSTFDKLRADHLSRIPFDTSRDVWKKLWDKHRRLIPEPISGDKLSITDTDLIVEFIREWLSNQTNGYGIMIPADDWEMYDVKGLRNFLKSLTPQPTGDVTNVDIEKSCERCLHGSNEECTLPEYGTPCDEFEGDVFWDRTNLTARVRFLYSEIAGLQTQIRGYQARQKPIGDAAASDYYHILKHLGLDDNALWDDIVGAIESKPEPTGDVADYLTGISNLVNQAHSKAANIRQVSGERDTDDHRKLQLSRSALGQIKTWLHNVQAKFPKLRTHVAALQQKAQMHDIVDEIRIEQQDMLFRLCDMLGIEHVEKIEETLHALQTSESEWRELCKGMVMPMEYMGMADDGWRHWECKFCTRSISSKTREVLKAQYCTNPKCPAVIARERMEERT